MTKRNWLGREELEATLKFKNIPFEGGKDTNLILPVGDGTALAFVFDEANNLDMVFSCDWQ